MKKVLAILLFCVLIFSSAFSVSAAYGDWRDYLDNVDEDLDDYRYNEWDDDWNDDYMSSDTAVQLNVPDIKLGGKTGVFDKKISRYEEYAVEFIVSSGSVSISDIAVYNSGPSGDASAFGSDAFPNILLEKISLVESEGISNQEKRSTVGKYPLKLGHNADGFGKGDVKYILGATGLNVTLQPGAYVIAVTPKEGSYDEPFGVTGWQPALCLFGKGNIDEFDSSLTDSARIALIKSVEGGKEFQQAYDSASWESASEETARIAAAIAEEQRKAAELAAKPITLKIDGEVVKVDSPPVLENGRVLVPARALVESFPYYSIEWDSGLQEVSVISYFSGEPVLIMTINSKRAFALGHVNGMPEMVPVQMDVPAKIINGRTMIPARFVSERLNCEVNWDASTRTVSVITGR